MAKNVVHLRKRAQHTALSLTARLSVLSILGGELTKLPTRKAFKPGRSLLTLFSFLGAREIKPCQTKLGDQIVC